MSEKNSKEDPNGVPAGFTERVGKERGDGWLIKASGVIVQGRLLGRYQMASQTDDDGKYRVYYQIQLAKPVKAMWQDPDDKSNKEERTLQAGSILNVDEHKALEDLGPKTRDGGVYNVWFRYLEETKLQGRGNRTFWSLKGPYLEVVKPPTRRPDPAPAAGPVKERSSGRMDDEDIPF